jgi:hypothetical protein
MHESLKEPSGAFGEAQNENLAGHVPENSRDPQGPTQHPHSTSARTEKRADRLLPGRADYDDIAATKVQIVLVAASGNNGRCNCTACRYD